MKQNKIISIEKDDLVLLAEFAASTKNWSLKKWIEILLENKAAEIRKKQLT